jgi:hypothetical protein
MRAAKQIQNSLKLEIRNKDDELNNARRDTTMQIELNQRLTSELEVREHHKTSQKIFKLFLK